MRAPIRADEHSPYRDYGTGGRVARRTSDRGGRPCRGRRTAGGERTRRARRILGTPAVADPNSDAAPRSDQPPPSASGVRASRDQARNGAASGGEGARGCVSWKQIPSRGGSASAFLDASSAHRGIVAVVTALAGVEHAIYARFLQRHTMLVSEREDDGRAGVRMGLAVLYVAPPAGMVLSAFAVALAAVAAALPRCFDHCSPHAARRIALCVLWSDRHQ